MLEFQFLRPLFLSLILPVLIIVWLIFRKAVPVFHWPWASILARESKGRTSWPRLMRFTAILLIGLILVFTAAGVYRGERVKYESLTSYVIILIQDRSGSMVNLLAALAKMSAALMEMRKQDKFCGVYFSDTATRTACGESAKVIAYISDEDLKNALSTGSTSMGGGTEPGSGLLAALGIALDEAKLFSKDEQDAILDSLDRKKIPFIPEEKYGSHKGFVAILESDAEFPSDMRIDPVQVLVVMKKLGIRAYFVVFTKTKAETVMRAVDETGGKTYFIDPSITDNKIALEQELTSVRNDIDALLPRETKIISGIEPRKFSKELGWGLLLSLVLLAASLVGEEIAKKRRTKGGAGHA